MRAGVGGAGANVFFDALTGLALVAAWPVFGAAGGEDDSAATTDAAAGGSSSESTDGEGGAEGATDGAGVALPSISWAELPVALDDWLTALGGA